MSALKALILLYVVMLSHQKEAQAALTKRTLHHIDRANNEGPYIGIVIPNLFELNPLLQSPSFTESSLTIDVAGRRFRFGHIAGKKVILVMTGLGMVNAGITTQLLLSLFDATGVVHYGTAGNANPSLHLGDVTIPQYWAHLGLWNWQKYGQGPEDELALEAQGDYSREYGHINFADFTTNVSNNSSRDNLLNNVWYQAEEVFPVDGTPEQRQHIFWIPVDAHYFSLSEKLENMKLKRCLNATQCLPTIPKVKRVERGASQSIFIANAAYRDAIYELFKVSPIEMESAGVALICHQQRVPFIIIRGLSGGGPSSSAEHSSDASTFLPLASSNSVLALVEFIKLLPPFDRDDNSSSLK